MKPSSALVQLLAAGLSLTLAAPARAGVVPVTTAAELIAAIDGAQPGDVITLAAGTYTVAQNLNCGVPGTPDDPIVVRAAVLGQALIRFDAVEGFKVSARHWVFENLDIRGICAVHSDCEHAFHLFGDADFTRIRFNRVRDFNAQIKSNITGGAFPDDVVVEAPLGLIGVAWLTRRYFPEAGGSGIPQAIASLSIKHDQQRDRLLSLRVAVGKILLTTLGLGCGASIGREGPTVHMGAAIMSSLGRLARFPPQALQRGLILAGGAGGIAAAFNTPLAGILFAVEEMSRSFEERSNGTILVTVLLAGVTALSILGNYTYFGSNNASLSFSSDWLAVPACGIIGGLLGGAFSAVLVYGTRRIVPFAKRHPYALAAICGLGISLFGLLSGGLTFGTGYQEASRVVTGSDNLPGSYTVLKMLATLASYLSGIPGGIFAPSLATGAALGSDLASWFPSTPAEAIVMLGMLAYFTGVVQTPITAFVIIMEMTQNQTMLLPLIATALIAYSVSRLVCPEPVYRALAKSFLTRETPPPPPAGNPP